MFPFSGGTQGARESRQMDTGRTPNPRRCTKRAHNKRTQNPDRAQNEPRPCEDERTLTHTNPTANPHQTHNTANRRRTHPHTRPTIREFERTQHGAHETHTKPRKAGQDARQPKVCYAIHGELLAQAPFLQWLAADTHCLKTLTTCVATRFFLEGAQMNGK